MTLATRPTVKVKFTAISDRTTSLLRARTELQQRQGLLKIGRTVFTWNGSPDDLDGLLDFLVMDEIPGSGANSKEVRRLRELRRMLRAARGIGPVTPESEGDAAHVAITMPAGDPDAILRDRVLDVLADAWWQSGIPNGAAWAEALETLAGGDKDRDEFRTWLDEVL